MNRRLASWATLAAALLLSACATPRPEPGELPWTSGRLSLRVAASPERPARSVAAAFELRGSSRQGELRLISPLGTVVASASWAPGMALLRTGDGEQSFTSLDQLSREALGESLPLAALPDWLAGRPWPEAPHARNEGGFEQLGWRIATDRLAEGLVTATRDAAPALLLRVKLDAPAT